MAPADRTSRSSTGKACLQGWTAAYAAAARSHINNGEECLSFDPDADAAAGSTIALTSGVTIIDDDNVGNAKTVPGTGFCLDLTLGGNLEVWTAPLTGGRVVSVSSTAPPPPPRSPLPGPSSG